MKINRIYLKNLNSLRGEFIIDLEQEPFANAGIFAITGPTGAGKSTILDAITLALYGRAARYDSKPNPENMMSRGTGDCQAEVEFEVSKGRYRASWQMKRARGKSDGKLQTAARYVYDSTGVALAQNNTEANKIVEELTGLDVDRFFRSVLLAQGDFVKFLKATPDERATLLESLTGTGIYTEISKRAHDETAQRGNALKFKELGLESIKLLSEDERAEEAMRSLTLQKEIDKNAQELTKLTTLITQGTELVKYLKQQEDVEKQLTSTLLKNTAMQIDFNKLNLHREGAQYYPELNNLDQAIKHSHEIRNDIESSEKVVIRSKHELRSCVEVIIQMISMQSIKTESAILESNKKNHEKSLEFKDLKIWLEAHQQDQTLDKHLSEMVELITNLSHSRNKIKEIQREQKIASQEFEEAQLNVKNYQRENGKAISHLDSTKQVLDLAVKNIQQILQDKTEEHIHAEIAAITAQLNHLEALKVADKEVQELKRILQQLYLDQENAQKTMNTCELNLKSSEEKLRKMIERRNENRLIANLHEHREKLELDHPCPLCGALEHPYMQNSDNPFAKTTDLETELKLLEKEVFARNDDYRKCLLFNAKTEETLKNKVDELTRTTLRFENIKNQLMQLNLMAIDAEGIDHEKILLNEQLLNARATLSVTQKLNAQKTEAQKALMQAQHSLELIQNTINTETKRIQASMKRMDYFKTELNHGLMTIVQLESILKSHLEIYNLPLPIEGEEKKLRSHLEERKNDYQKNLKRHEQLSTELSSLNIEIKGLEFQCKQLEVQQEQLKQFIKINEIECTDHKKNQNISVWKTLEEAYEGLKNLETVLTQSKTTFNDLKKSLLKSEMHHSTLEVHLSQKMLTSPFKTIEFLRSVQLSTVEVQCIEKKFNEIKLLTDRLQMQLEQSTNEIKCLLMNQTPQGDSLQATQERYKELHKQTNDMHGLIAVSRAKLLDDDKNRLDYTVKFDDIEIHRTRLFIWQKLSGLIGSHDGKVFRKFAQGLSLDLLIKHANTHLSSLSNRYRLKRTMEDELDLEIMDLHQANATRPTASLSGGESFLTSLALALGLSDLAGKNVRIDSLFIDEGFGSLDSETLETAVQALESLRSKNKTIGVISHIELLKERISTQIVIEKSSGGISTMSFCG